MPPPHAKPPPKTPARIVLGAALGVCLLLLTIEISMRVLGAFYLLDRLDLKSVLLPNPDRGFRILCVGDSFTFGYGAPASMSYPEQLEGMFRAAGMPVSVFNEGRPAMNSSQLRNRLEPLISRYRPHLVAVLIGSNDFDNPAETDRSPGEQASFTGRLRSASSELRVVKLARWAWRVLLFRMGRGASSGPDPGRTRRPLYPRQPAEYQVFLDRFERHKGERDPAKAEAALRQAIRSFPERNMAHYFLAAEILLPQFEAGNHPKIQEALRAAEAFLRLTPPSDSEWRGHGLQLRRGILMLLGLERAPSEGEMASTLSRNLDAILRAVEAGGAWTLMLNYPAGESPLPDESALRREACARHDCSFVDLRKRFSQVFRSTPLCDVVVCVEGRNYSSHLTARGYRIMAEAVHEAVNSAASSRRGARPDPLPPRP